MSINYTPKSCITWSAFTAQWTYNQLQKAASKSFSCWCLGCNLLCILDARHWYFKIVSRPEKVCCIVNYMKLNLLWECNSFVLNTKQIYQVICHFVVGTCFTIDDCVFKGKAWRDSAWLKDVLEKLGIFFVQSAKFVWNVTRQLNISKRTVWEEVIKKCVHLCAYQSQTVQQLKLTKFSGVTFVLSFKKSD